MTTWLIADGGNKPSGAYGSFLILCGPSLSRAEEIEHKSFRLPEASTNNEAEYWALISGLKALLGLKIGKVKILMDSQLVLNQVMGEWSVKAMNLKPLCGKAIKLLGEFEEITIEHIGRDVIVHYLGH